MPVTASSSRSSSSRAASSAKVAVVAAGIQIGEGAPGKSAYQSAVANGFKGSEELWLSTVVGGGFTYALFTTAKIVIENNRMLLPTEPNGAMLFNMALVYDANSVVTEYDGITVTSSDGQFYACFNEPNAVTGSGVVSYLIKVRQ